MQAYNADVKCIHCFIYLLYNILSVKNMTRIIADDEIVYVS